MDLNVGANLVFALVFDAGTQSEHKVRPYGVSSAECAGVYASGYFHGPR